MKTLRLSLLLFLLLQTACEWPTGIDRLRRENRGTPLTPAEVAYIWLGPEASSILSWSPDGSEIFYIRKSMRVIPPNVVKAVNVTTKTMRVVSGYNAGQHTIRLSQDGGALYILAGGDSNQRVQGIYRVPSGGGSMETVVNPRSGLFGSFHVAGNQSHLLYRTYGDIDSIFLHDLTNRREGFADRGNPLGFSPTGEQFVYSAGSRLVIASTQDPDQRTQLDPCAGRIEAIRWEGGTIQALVRQGSGSAAEIWVTNPTGCGGRKVREIELSPDVSPAVHPDYYLRLSWSPDGNSVAAWIFQECVAWHTTLLSERCTRGYYTLQLVDVRTGRMRQIGAAIPNPETEVPSHAVYSPDGRRLAYVIDGILYLKDLP